MAKHHVAKLEIHWVGKVKATKEAIENALDALFFDLTMDGGIIEGYTTVKFTREDS